MEGHFASTLSFKLPDYLKIVEFLENKPFNQKLFFWKFQEKVKWHENSSVEKIYRYTL